MKRLVLLYIFFPAVICYSQNSFDSSNIPPKILKVLRQFPDANNKTLIKLDDIYRVKGFNDLSHLKRAAYLNLTNYPKASVRIFASKNLINIDFKMLWELLAKNSYDTTDYFLCSIEDGIMPMTHIDYLLGNFAINTAEHPFTTDQIKLITALKEERKNT